MTARKGATNTANIVRSLDTWMASLWQWSTRPGPLRTATLGIVAASVVAGAMVPFRDSIGTANVGLTLGIIVALVGAQGGLAAGAACAVWASGLFALLHSVPHGLPRIEDEQDAITAVLLIATGLLSGWARKRQLALQHRITSARDDIARLHLVGALAAESATDDVDPDELMSAVAEEIRSVLDLAECRWEPGARTDAVRSKLLRSGLIEDVADHLDPAQVTAALEQGVTIDLGHGGEMILLGRPGVAATPHQLKMAVLLVDYAAAA